MSFEPDIPPSLYPLADIQHNLNKICSSEELARIEVQVALDRLTEVTMALAGVATSQGAEVLLANATPYLHMVGHTVVAWMWLEQAILAQERLDDGNPEADFLRGKLQAAQYFFRWELPRTAVWAGVLAPVDRTCLDTDPAWL